MLDIETIERMSTRARIRKKKKKGHNRIMPRNIYICARLSSETNELVAEWNRIGKGREKEEEDSSQPKTCARPIVTSIGWKQTYREASAVTASKKPAGSAWRESAIVLRIGFESNIHTYIHRLSLAWPSQSTGVISFSKSPLVPFFFSHKLEIFHLFRHSQTIHRLYNETPSFFLLYIFSRIPLFDRRENKLQESIHKDVGRPRNNTFMNPLWYKSLCFLFFRLKNTWDSSRL